MVDILLVDDETYVTESLALTIPWRELGINQVYQAASAPEAMILLREKSIKIVVTDIRMPEQTGLELIKQAKDIYPGLRTVLLTGYSDFEYAKQAIRLQACDYLLKPVDDEAFINCITSQVAALEQERLKEEQAIKQLYSRKSDFHVLRRQLMHDLLQGKLRASSNLIDLLQKYEVNIEIGQSCILLTVQLGGRFLNMDAQSKELIQYGIGNIAEEIFVDRYNVWHSSTPDEHVAIILALSSESSTAVVGKEQTRALATVLMEHASSYLNGKLTIVATDWFEFPDKMDKHYQKTVNTLYRMHMENGDVVILTEEVPSKQGSGHAALEELYKPPALIHTLESGQWQATKDKLSVVFTYLAQQHYTLEHLYEAYIAISNALIYVSNKMGIDLQDIGAKGVNLLLDRSMLSSVESLKQWSEETIDLISIQYDDSDSYNKKHIIKQVQELISKEMGLEASVKTIADRVFLHPVYLSKLFKHETGESLGDYMMRIRMERAVYLLKHTNKKIYEITTELGYQNPQYFSKVFRKHYGCTPNEYRDQ